MENPMIEQVSEGLHPKGFITGLLLGGLAGAVAVLLVTPHSGEKTRAIILNKSKELREQSVETVEDAVTQARTKVHQITADVRDKTDELQQRGQEVLNEQKERLSAAVESGNAAIQGVLD